MNYLIWNIDPEIFRIGPFAPHWYGLFFAAGFFLGYSIMVRIYRHERRAQENLSSLFFYIFVGTVAGARLGHVLFYQPDYYLQRPWEIFMIWQGGLASHGGFAGVLIAIYFYLRKYRDMSFLELADRLAIPALLGAAFIRVGNFFNSEILGLPSNVSWAVVFYRVDMVPRHPAMLYEAVAYFLGFCALYVAFWKTSIARFPGRILGIALTVSFVARFLVEFVKEEQVPFEQAMLLNMGQLLSIPFIAGGIWFIYLSSSSRPTPDARRAKRISPNNKAGA